MKTLKGSEKQVAWAESIIAGWKNGIDKNIAEAKDRVARNTMPAIWSEIIERVGNEWKEKIDTIDSASSIINDRNMPIAQSVFDIASKEYEAAK